MWKWFHKLGSPPHFYRIAGAWAPWFGWGAALLIAAGLYGGLVLAPPDEEMGEGFRIIYVHVPAAWLSLFAYTYMAVLAAVGLIWRIKLAHAIASACAVLGASFTFLALVTGSIWGKPMWGTWWQWDARLTSELLLLFLFLGYLALREAFDDVNQADRASAVLAIVGVVNVPIIHFSVEWWRTLHQPPTLITQEGAAYRLEHADAFVADSARLHRALRCPGLCARTHRSAAPRAPEGLGAGTSAARGGAGCLAGGAEPRWSRFLQHRTRQWRGARRPGSRMK